jgi:hypothetical protein
VDEEGAVHGVAVLVPVHGDAGLRGMLRTQRGVQDEVGPLAHGRGGHAEVCEAVGVEVAEGGDLMPQLLVGIAAQDGVGLVQR